MDVLQRQFLRDRQVPFLQDIHFVYKHTKDTNSPLRWFVVDLHNLPTARGEEMLEGLGGEDFPQEFLEECVRRLGWGLVELGWVAFRRWRFRGLGRCFYHVHVDRVVCGQGESESGSA